MSTAVFELAWEG